MKKEESSHRSDFSGGNPRKMLSALFCLTYQGGDTPRGSKLLLETSFCTQFTTLVLIDADLKKTSLKSSAEVYRCILQKKIFFWSGIFF